MKLESIRNKFKIEVDKTFKNISKKLNKNELKNEIRKIIQTSIRQDNDIKKYETLYNSLNPNSQTTIKAKIKTIEEVLNEETYLKTQILENENNKNKKIDANKPTDVVVVKDNNINLNEAKPEDKKNNNNTEDHKDDINKDIKSKSVKIINHISLNDFNNYSFKCLTKNLNFTIKKGTSEAIFKIICENDGEFPWPKNKTILSTDKSKSNIKIQDILMEPLNPRSKCTFDIKFRNMGRLQEGKYYSYLDFKVEGKKYGNSILINVEVIDDIKTKYKPIIDVVRDEYNLDKNAASDTLIARGIDKTKTIEGAFNYIVEKKND
jgi:hypothetical protein